MSQAYTSAAAYRQQDDRDEAKDEGPRHQILFSHARLLGSFHKSASRHNPCGFFGIELQLAALFGLKRP
jgi:hypothetical protein